VGSDEGLAVDLQEALTIVPLLRQRLNLVRLSRDHVEVRYRRTQRLNRRLAYWARRATKLQAQLQEVSDEYPLQYLQIQAALRSREVA
jgi:hypothetical protein